MSFQPSHLLGRPLPELLAELAHADPDDVLAGAQGAVELYGPDLTTDVDPVACTHKHLYTTLVQETELSGSDVDLPAGVVNIELPGVVLERYLGGGGQGWVYAGRLRDDGHLIAVKVLRGDYFTGGGKAAREARVCSGLSHYNLLRVFRAEKAGDFWVVLMELVRGSELSAERVGAGCLRGCFAQLADALNLLAERRIVHRDVKPANILVREHDGSPVLVDFGLAVDLNGEEPHPVVSGTPLFMAPEALTDAAPDPSWDAYSLGVTAAVTLGVSLEAEKWGLSALRSAKRDGRFDAELLRALEWADDVELADWARGLISPEPARRVAALPAARRWRAA